MRCDTVSTVFLLPHTHTQAHTLINTYMHTHPHARTHKYTHASRRQDSIKLVSGLAGELIFNLTVCGIFFFPAV